MFEDEDFSPVLSLSQQSFDVPSMLLIHTNTYKFKFERYSISYAKVHKRLKEYSL